MALATGTRVGVYEVLGAIGAGGMGEVYKARDTRLNRDVALKVLPASVADDPDRLARFRREAQVLASLNHPNIATVHGFEEAPSTGSGQAAVRALVMELVDGVTLAEKGRLALADSLPIARQIAEALEAAHEQGVVHRDLKPANVKVRNDGTVKVLDFGLAKALDANASSASADGMNSPTLTARATQLGVILGTAAYMSPEQAKGRPVDRRADIWAFGVVFYEMLSGRRGYEAEDISDTLAAVLTREVDWTALPADTPPRLVQLLRDCLVRDPKQRLRDIGEARRVIDRVISGAPDSSVVGVTAMSAGKSGPIAVAPPVPTWRSMLPWAVAAAATIAVAVFAWQALHPPAPLRGVVTRSKAPLKELSGFVALSRDGARLTYTVTNGPQGFALVLRQMDQFDGKLLAGSEGAVFPVFSPAGDSIAYSTLDTPTRIKKVPIAGGTASTLCEGSFINGGAWGDDDTIVFGGPKGLMRVSANGGTPQTLTELDAAKGETVHSRPQFLPGATQLLFTVSNADGPHFAVLDLQKGAYRIVAKGGDNGRYVPTGHLTFVRANTLFAVPFDLGSLTSTGGETPVIESVASVGPPGTGDYAFSDTGMLVYSEALAAAGTTLSWIDRKGILQPIPGQSPRLWGTGRLSADGLRVANSIQSEKGSDIWVADLARATPTRLTFSGENSTPIWTPDGKRVVFGATKDGKSGVYSVAADASGQPELIADTASPVVPTSFAPDGKTLLYTQGVPNGRAHVMVLAVGTAAREAHSLREGNGGDGEAQISPDGRWVAYSSAEAGTLEIYVQPFPGPGAKVRVSTAGGRSARWARKGRELDYWTATPGTASLMSVAIPDGPAFAPGAPEALFQFFSGSTWDVTPDPGRFLVETVVAQAGVGTVLATVTNWFDELRQRAPAKK